MMAQTIGVLTMALTVLWTQRVWAEKAPCTPVPSASQLQQAQVLADEGYELLVQRLYDEAAERYLRALEHVRDPLLHLQAGSAFFNALRMVDAYEHLSEALRCGRDNLTTEQMAEARRKLRLLSKRLGQVTVDCRAEGAQVRLGELDWFTCADNQTRLLVVGQYEIHVTRDGHVPVQQVITVTPGKRVTVQPVVMSEAQARTVTHRWPRWLPWGLMGSGVAVGAIGGVLQWDASRRMASSTQALEACLEPSVGCMGSEIEEYEGIQNWARWQNRVAVGSVVLGSAALAVGLAIVVGNRAQLRLDSRAGTAEVQVMPMTVRDGGGLSLKLDY